MGRLKAVVDPASDAAIYSYDAVGNVLSIQRQSATTVSIIEFTPERGPAGQTVTIYGTGFAANPGDNQVAFNGTPATVTSATPTQLVTIVPSDATSGPITITTPSGTATSTTPFQVGESQAPVISSFTPTVGAPGTAVTITGSNFEDDPTRNVVAFNTTRAQIGSSSSTSLTAMVPAPATSGRLSVTTPYGIATSSQDFIVPPPGFGVGDIEFTGRMAPGDTKSLTISSAHKIGLMLFDGTQGQRISIGIPSNSMGTYTHISILNPDGSMLLNRECTCFRTFLDVKTLPMSGTYTILIDPDGANTGSITLRLYDVPPDPTGSVEIDGPSVTMTTTVPGQNAHLTFEGDEGRHISVRIHTNTMGRYTRLSIIRPDGSMLLNRECTCLRTVLDVKPLPMSGTYTILIDPDGASVGMISISLQTETTIESSSATESSTGIPSPTTAELLSVVSNLSEAADTSETEDTSASPSDSGAGNPVTHALPDERPRCEPIPDATETVDGAQLDWREWVPDEWNLKGNWTTRWPTAKCASLPPLLAPPGVTALSGQVLELNGKPLKDVTLRIGDRAVQTDENGQFLFTDLPAGHHLLVVDGTELGMPGKGGGKGTSDDADRSPENGKGNDKGQNAGPGNGQGRNTSLRNGVFQIGVDLAAGETTVLPYTIWMPRLDIGHTVRFASPTADEVVLTNPHIPGLEVHIPKGATVTTQDGTPVTELGITPIPVDRPPFPLPFGVYVPIYFTVQPAGTLIVPEGAWIVYPNYTNQAPGSRVDFWHYDPVTEG